jgi:menaquinone-dependent protoporphyrinogen oxidase
VVTCSGLTALATYRPQTVLEQTSYGDPNMSKRVLIAYATKCGSSMEVAEAIGKTISQNDIAVDIKSVKKMADITGYDAVILGSAVRMGQWLPEAVDFIKRHQSRLNQLPMAIFSVHIMNMGDSPESIAARQAYTVPVREMITPSAEAFFPGQIDASKLSFFERMLGRIVSAPEGDFRDWEAINSWAAEAYTSLS